MLRLRSCVIHQYPAFLGSKIIPFIYNQIREKLDGSSAGPKTLRMDANKPSFFLSQLELREWLKSNHSKSSEIYVGLYKKTSQKLSLTWSQSVDEALCFGWIDGLTKSIDNESYCIRFTPRRKNSVWSARNINKVEKLLKAGLMTRAGIDAYNLRSRHKSSVYAHEQKEILIDEHYEEDFKKNTRAWVYFEEQTSVSYRKTVKHWIMSGKREATRRSRLEKTIEASAAGRRIKL